MRTGGDPAKHRVGGVEFQRVPGRLPGEQAARKPIRQSGLADALRSGDQPGMMHAPGTERIEDGGLGVRVAQEKRIGAWRGSRHEAVIAGFGITS